MSGSGVGSQGSEIEALKAAIAAWAGTALEFYDFLVFGFLATVLAPLFFPSSNSTVSLLSLFAVFGVGFLMRPVGAVVFGWIGDRHVGRRNTLMITIFLMGAASLFMGLLPTYQQIGISASILIVVLRLIQGFALGGEFGGGITLTAELSPATRRGLYVGIAQMAQGGFIPSVLITIFATAMSHASLISYGWRILFILGVVIAVVGFFIRIKLTESHVYLEAARRGKISKAPIGRAFARYPLKMLMAIFIVVGGTVVTYTFATYGVTYMIKYEGFSLAQSSLILAIATGMFMVLTPLWSFFSDKFGRKIFMIVTPLSLIILVYPFYVLLSTAMFAVALLAYIMVYVFYSIWNGPYATVLSEMFPTSVRYTAVSFSYNFAVGIFGGFSPFVVTYLIAVTHNKLAPVYWLIPCLVLSLIAVLLYKETKGINLETIPDRERTQSP